MSNPRYFIVDAETDGLDGDFLSIAAAVYDDGWKCLDDYYSAVSNAKSDNDWVQKNVLPHLKNAKKLVTSEEALLQDFFLSFNKDCSCSTTGDPRTHLCKK